jgi:hypothetical protein
MQPAGVAFGLLPSIEALFVLRYCYRRREFSGLSPVLAASIWNHVSRNEHEKETGDERTVLFTCRVRIVFDVLCIASGWRIDVTARKKPTPGKVSTFVRTSVALGRRDLQILQLISILEGCFYLHSCAVIASEIRIQNSFVTEQPTLTNVIFPSIWE